MPSKGRDGATGFDAGIDWDQLVRELSPLLYRWTRQAGIGEFDINDIVQEVFLALLQAAQQNQWPRAGSFHPWLWRVWRYRLLRHLQYYRSIPICFKPPHLLEISTVFADASDNAPPATVRLINEFRARFAKTVWEAFWRTIVLDDDTQDVAEDLGVSIWAIYKARDRVLRSLKHACFMEHHPSS